MNQESIRMNINLIIKHKEDAKENFMFDISRYDGVIRMMQGFCVHEDLTYYPDPSGNNDSSYVCDTCGLEKKRKADFRGDKCQIQQ